MAARTARRMLFQGSDCLLSVVEFERAMGGSGSAVPVRLVELRTYALRRMPTSAARSSATALENEHLRAAVGRWRLYFETGRWRGDFLAEAMTASGQKLTLRRCIKN